MDDFVVHKGGCHCGRVRWEARAPVDIKAGKCNCSNCSMRGLINFGVPECDFQLQEESKEFLTTYTFGTHTAKHIFCKICGITSYYIQRDHPGKAGVALNLNCVDPGTIKYVEIKHFDGKNWDWGFWHESFSDASTHKWLCDKAEKLLSYHYEIELKLIYVRFEFECHLQI